MSMPTPHIEVTNPNIIASTVLMPGDPLRAKFIAETYLDNPILFNQIRGMLGYTGTYKGKRVSVMGSGMGIPSIGIYSYELFSAYDVVGHTTLITTFMILFWQLKHIVNQPMLLYKTEIKTMFFTHR